MEALGEPDDLGHARIKDCNYPDLIMNRTEVTDHLYLPLLEPFEWKVAKRLKEDKGYMGKMSFPENLDKPARTVMATMSKSSREAMILKHDENQFRLPTVREAATIMSFPIDYRFYGPSVRTKYTLVGNAVPPKLSHALAHAILLDMQLAPVTGYRTIHHANWIPFFNLNGTTIPTAIETPKRINAKFKYHIPYLIINAYRVELTNYHSDFSTENFIWSVELHYSQGKKRAKKYDLTISKATIPSLYHAPIDDFIDELTTPQMTFRSFQEAHCMTETSRLRDAIHGPYEVLQRIRDFIDKNNLIASELHVDILHDATRKPLHLSLIIGYYILQEFLRKIGG